jgi:hypothetical protein
MAIWQLLLVALFGLLDGDLFEIILDFGLNNFRDIICELGVRKWHN